MLNKWYFNWMGMKQKRDSVLYLIKLMLMVLILAIITPIFSVFGSSQEVTYYKIHMENRENMSSIYYTEEFTNITDFLGEPSYTLGIQVSDNQVNRGDVYKLGFYITGAGNVDFAKVSISIPGYIVENEAVNYTTIRYKFNNSTFLMNSNSMDIPVSLESEIMSPSFGGRINNMHFVVRNYSIFDNYGQKKYIKDGKRHYPFEIEFKIPKDAAAGDHYIYLNLFYKYKDKWYNDRQVVTLHINRWYEAEYLQYIVYALAILEILRILGILRIARRIGSGLFKWLRRKLKEWGGS